MQNPVVAEEKMLNSIPILWFYRAAVPDKVELKILKTLYRILEPDPKKKQWKEITGGNRKQKQAHNG